MAEIDLDLWHMERALELAALGRGAVEPNPMVGCIIVHGAEVVGQGWHRAFGSPHAEVEALQMAGPRARGATLVVTLEPCSHHGKTPPCTDAIIAAGIVRVVAAMQDPNPLVSGSGFARLQAANIEVVRGTCEERARSLNAPFCKLLERKLPWVHAKWAMTADGKLASRSGVSQWISSPESRATAHQLRGLCDAILVGRQTALTDDPLLTPRPPGSRKPARIVLSSQAELAMASKLVTTSADAPVIVAAAESAPVQRLQALRAAGCETLLCPGQTHALRLKWLLEELGRRQMTHLLVEGGSQVLGSFFDADFVDEVHAFIAPLCLGGEGAKSPLAGQGRPSPAAAIQLTDVRHKILGPDIYLHGRVVR